MILTLLYVFILQTSHIKNNQLNGEIQFSKALHMFRENIYKEANTLKDKNQSKEYLQFSTLEVCSTN